MTTEKKSRKEIVEWWDNLSVGEAYTILQQVGAYKFGFDDLLDMSWVQLPSQVQRLLQERQEAK